jgi:hypothetical protein
MPMVGASPTMGRGPGECTIPSGLCRIRSDSQGGSKLATLGFGTESLRDSLKLLLKLNKLFAQLHNFSAEPRHL